jgi:3-hydroxyisobutyrate dehydrogenase
MSLSGKTIGWIGVGRMGYAMALRLLNAGADLSVYNRTRSNADPLVELGAKAVDTPADLADRDIVFSMVSGPESFIEVITGENGLLSGDGTPSLLIDCTTLSTEASATVRKAAAEKGVSMIDAPVSGNAKVVEAGLLSIVASGKRSAFDEALPFLDALAEGVTYVGEGELARTVKICHNLFLGAVTQSLAEVTVLAEKSGVPRSALLDFINKSVMGSRFSKYKTPAFVNLDYTPTFTSTLLRKDLDLGLSAGNELDVPLPVTAMVRDLVQALIDSGHADSDFAALLELQAKAAKLDLEPEDTEVGTGL